MSVPFAHRHKHSTSTAHHTYTYVCLCRSTRQTNTAHHTYTKICLCKSTRQTMDSSGLELQVPITRVVGWSLRKFPGCLLLPCFAVVNPLPVLPLSIFGFRGTTSFSSKFLCQSSSNIFGQNDRYLGRKK